MKKRVLRNKKGSALLIAIVIMMVVTMLGLALLLVSYSLFATSNRQNSAEQCTALAQSLNRELEEEITISQFKDYASQTKALNDGKFPVWFYLRFNVWQTNWPYYNSEERGHTEEFSNRYFKLEGSGDEVNEAVDDISILIYWESEADADKAGTQLVVQVTCTKGKQKSTITSTYELVIGANDYEDIKTGDEATTTPQKYNPGGNTIETGEIWSWSLTERE